MNMTFAFILVQGKFYYVVPNLFQNEVFVGQQKLKFIVSEEHCKQEFVTRY